LIRRRTPVSSVTGCRLETKKIVFHFFHFLIKYFSVCIFWNLNFTRFIISIISELSVSNYAPWHLYLVSNYAPWLLYLVSNYTPWHLYLVSNYAPWHLYLVSNYAPWHLYLVLKEFSQFHKLRFSNPNIFATQCRRP